MPPTIGRVPTAPTAPTSRRPGQESKNTNPTGPVNPAPRPPQQPSGPSTSKICIVNTTSGGPRCYYGIHAAVGPNAPNARADVLVVQYFLKVVLEEHESFQKHPFPKRIAVDGVAGPVTFAAIRHFQRTLSQEGYEIVVDGRVDPTLSGGTKGSISGVRYTILYLNGGYKHCRPGDWPRVSQAWDCPEELRALFREPPAPPFYGA